MLKFYERFCVNRQTSSIHTVVGLEYRRRPVPLRAKAEFRPRPDDLCWPSPAFLAAASGAASSRSILDRHALRCGALPRNAAARCAGRSPPHPSASVRLRNQQVFAARAARSSNGIPTPPRPRFLRDRRPERFTALAAVAGKEDVLLIFRKRRRQAAAVAFRDGLSYLGGLCLQQQLKPGSITAKFCEMDLAPPVQKGEYPIRLRGGFPIQSDQHRCVKSAAARRKFDEFVEGKEPAETIGGLLAPIRHQPFSRSVYTNSLLCNSVDIFQVAVPRNDRSPRGTSKATFNLKLLQLISAPAKNKFVIIPTNSLMHLLTNWN